MEDGQNNWRRFQRIKFNRKAFSRRAKKAEGATVRHAHKFIIGRWDNIRSVRRHVITWFVCVGLLIAAVGAQVVWFQRSYMTMGPVGGGVYAEAVKGPVSTLNPLYATSSAELAASHLMFSSLYDYDQTGHLRGDLATSMKVDPTSKEYTVTLRPNAKWHDGVKLTANDVIFTINLMKDSTTRANPALRAAWHDIQAVALTDTTLKFTLPSVNAAFPQALTFAVLPQHVLKDVAASALRENSFSNNPIGSGPFKMRLLQLISESEGHKIVHMVAFPDYYRGAPRLSRFQLHVFGSTDRIMAALKTSEVNAATDMGYTDVANVDANRYDTISKPVNGGVYALLNTSQPYLKDKKVRQALQIGTDTAAVRKSITPSLHPLDLPFVDGQLTGSDVPRAPAFDQARAAQLLTDAGWVLQGGNRVKDGQKLTLQVVTIKEPEYERTLEVLTGQWRKLGITLDTQVVDPNDPTQDFTQDVLQRRNYDVLINRLIIGADPDVYAYWHSSQATALGKNYSNYSNSFSDDALTGALTRIEPELRNAKYKSFAKQWLEDAPAIGLYQANMYYVHSKVSRTLTDDERIISPENRYGGVIHWTVDQGMIYKTP
jgi:peptide/nickel transport system substrate-binding protein